MFFIYLLAALVVPLIITPGLLFHFDTEPKVIVTAIAAVVCLFRFRELPKEAAALWSRRPGRFFVVIAALQLVWTGIATLTSTRPWFSLFGSNWRRFGLVETAALAIVALGIAAALSARPREASTLLRLMLCAGIAASIYGIFQYFGIDPFQPVAAYQAHAGNSVIVRTPGTMGHADYFGWWLAVEFFCALASLQTEESIWKHVAVVAAMLTFMAVLLSGTRAALLGILAGLVAMALMAPSSIRVHRKHILLAAAVVFLFAVFVFSSAGTLLRARAVWAGDEPLGGARPLIWRDSLRMAVARPVFGFGPETFLTAFARYQSEDLSRLFPDFHHESPHNLALDALTSTGFPGLLLMIGWAVLAGVTITSARQRGLRLAIPLTGALVASGTAAMFSAASTGPVLLSLLIIGVLVSESVSEAASPATPLRWPLRLLGGLAACGLAAFAVMLTLEDFRLEEFARRPREATYQTIVSASLPGAGEDLYISRILQQDCGKRVGVVSFLSCRQQVMQASGKALKTSDDTTNAWYSLSMLSASQNELVWTRRGLEEAISASPNWFKPHWALARFLAQSGDRKRAAEEAVRAAFLDANRDSEVVETAGQLTARK
jgi:O-antigen ligase